MSAPRPVLCGAATARRTAAAVAPSSSATPAPGRAGRGQRDSEQDASSAHRERTLAHTIAARSFNVRIRPSRVVALERSTRWECGHKRRQHLRSPAGRRFGLCAASIFFMQSTDWTIFRLRLRSNWRNTCPSLSRPGVWLSKGSIPNAQLDEICDSTAWLHGPRCFSASGTSFCCVGGGSFWFAARWVQHQRQHQLRYR